MKTVIREGPNAIAASVVGTMAPTVKPIADAAKDSTVTIPQNFPNLESKTSRSVHLVTMIELTKL